MAVFILMKTAALMVLSLSMIRNLAFYNVRFLKNGMIRTRPSISSPPPWPTVSHRAPVPLGRWG